MLRYCPPLDELCTSISNVPPSQNDWEEYINNLKTIPTKSLQWQELPAILAEIHVRNTINLAGKDMINLDSQTALKHPRYAIVKSIHQGYHLVDSFTNKGRFIVNQFDHLFMIGDNPIIVEVKTGQDKREPLQEIYGRTRTLFSICHEKIGYILLLPKDQLSDLNYPYHKELLAEGVRIVPLYDSRKELRLHAEHALRKHASDYFKRYFTLKKEHFQQSAA